MQSTDFTQYQIDRQIYVRNRINIIQRVVGFDECWEWTLKLDKNGYGHGLFAGRSMGAHRCSYLAFVGPVPEGLHLDHLCNNRACVNPTHLEPVTLSVNSLRAVERDRLNGTGHWDQLETCTKGLHPMTDDNVCVQTVRGHQKRFCATCTRERARTYRQADPERYARYNAANYLKQKARRKALKLAAQQ